MRTKVTASYKYRSNSKNLINHYFMQLNASFKQFYCLINHLKVSAYYYKKDKVNNM